MQEKLKKVEKELPKRLKKHANGKKTAKANRMYKDRIFRMLFHDKRNLLELYNALNGSHYKRFQDLKIVTLENAIYMGMKNDLSFLFRSEICLFEQQASRNPNMPLRCLFYISDSYSMLTDQENLYSTGLVKIPTPRFVVLYNGLENMPERELLYLSSAYESPVSDPDLELRVQVLNINAGYNQKILKVCKTLREYMIFVDKIRSYAKTKELTTAVDEAIDECIQENILRDFLRKNRAEVKKMSIYEYDEERNLEDHYKEGIKMGERSGGIRTLIEVSEEYGISDAKIRSKLKGRFSLNDTEIQKAMRKYSRRHT